MTIRIVTIKLERDPDHDPRNKVTGKCPASGGMCTDVTGEHHTLLARNHIEFDSILAKFPHVTRVEDV